MKRSFSLDLPPGVHSRHSPPEGVVAAELEKVELEEERLTL